MNQKTGYLFSLKPDIAGEKSFFKKIKALPLIIKKKNQIKKESLTKTCTSGNNINAKSTR